MSSFCSEVLEEYYLNAKSVFSKISDSIFRDVVSSLLNARTIFVLGIGHSGTIARVFTMKLNHVGLKAYTVFDEINPPFGVGDLFVAVSQSGETKTILALAEKAKRLGGKVVAITSAGESRLAKLSEHVLKIDKKAEEVKFPILDIIGEERHENLSGTLFGFNIYVLFYALAIMVARERGESPESIDARHQNLQ